MALTTDNSPAVDLLVSLNYICVSVIPLYFRIHSSPVLFFKSLAICNGDSKFKYFGLGGIINSPFVRNYYKVFVKRSEK